MPENDLEIARKLLGEGKLVAIPTETVYGLAANALDSRAVAHIFKVKNRPKFDPLICHLASIEQVEKYVADFPPQAQVLAKAFWPGPLTLVLPKKDLIPDLVSAGLNTVGIRIPRHPLTLALLKSIDFPLAAPSANPFGYVSPTEAQHVKNQLGPKIDYILDGGPCTVGIESTIVGFPEGKATIYRLGGVALEKIQAYIPEILFSSFSTSQPQAPGMLSSHYAPDKRLVIIQKDRELHSWLKEYSRDQIATLRFKEPLEGIPSSQQVILSSSGNFLEAAQKLFAGLRHLDGLSARIILAELLPEKDLGRAINDRIRRAAAS